MVVVVGVVKGALCMKLSLACLSYPFCVIFFLICGWHDDGHVRYYVLVLTPLCFVCFCEVSPPLLPLSVAKFSRANLFFFFFFRVCSIYWRVFFPCLTVGFVLARFLPFPYIVPLAGLGVQSQSIGQVIKEDKRRFLPSGGSRVVSSMST